MGCCLCNRTFQTSKTTSTGSQGHVSRLQLELPVPAGCAQFTSNFHGKASRIEACPAGVAPICLCLHRSPPLALVFHNAYRSRRDPLLHQLRLGRSVLTGIGYMHFQKHVALQTGPPCSFYLKKFAANHPFILNRARATHTTWSTTEQWVTTTIKKKIFTHTQANQTDNNTTTLTTTNN